MKRVLSSKKVGFSNQHTGNASAKIGFAPRHLAASLLAAVEKGKLLDHLLDEGPLAERYQALEPRDRAFVRALTGITLRRFGQIENALSRFLERPLPDDAGLLRPILATAIAQILFMHIADHAAVALAVDLVAADKASAPFKGLANAVLRKVSADKEAILATQDPVRLNTPDWLLQRWENHYGAETAYRLAGMHLIEPYVDLTIKENPAQWAERLGGCLLPNGSVRVLAEGAIEKLDGYEEGAWWVQDAAATFPVFLLGEVSDLKVGDLCAAPGGKTALLAARGARVTAVDISYHRLGRLKRNLKRLGLDADIVVADAGQWLGGPFDKILLDAPCTATGTLRRHPDGLVAKKLADIPKMAAQQRALLDQAIRLVRPGGLIVYATCSLEPEEGPDQIRRLMLIDAPVERIPITPAEVYGHEEFLTPEGDLRTLPSHLPHSNPRLSGLDGFFVARLRRRD